MDSSYSGTASLDAEDLLTAASLMLLAQLWIMEHDAAQRAINTEGT